MVSRRPINFKKFPVPSTYQCKKVSRRPEMVFRRPINFKKVSRRPEMVFRRPINFKKVSRRPEMVFRRPINFKKVFRRPEMVSDDLLIFTSFPSTRNGFPATY